MPKMFLKITFDYCYKSSKKQGTELKLTWKTIKQTLYCPRHGPLKRALSPSESGWNVSPRSASEVHGTTGPRGGRSGCTDAFILTRWLRIGRMPALSWGWAPVPWSWIAATSWADDRTRTRSRPHAWPPSTRPTGTCSSSEN